MESTKKLTGDRCQCQTCKHYFNSTSAFDKHRVGPHGPERRCLSPDEMRQRGMTINTEGFWIGKPRSSIDRIGAARKAA